LGTERYVPSLREREEDREVWRRNWNGEAERVNGCREYRVWEGRARWVREMGILRIFGEMRRGGRVENLEEGWKHVIQ
jgi:hypothetical protein